jgi:CO/xanthine dehydrogenase Mo-binding subunit
MLNHGGTEMGQGLFIKVAQVVAEELAVNIDRIRMTASDTSKVPNASPTAASSGSDINGKAAQAAARKTKRRLTAIDTLTGENRLLRVDILHDVRAQGSTRNHFCSRSCTALATTCVARRNSSSSRFSSGRFALDSPIVRGPAPYMTIGTPCSP